MMMKMSRATGDKYTTIIGMVEVAKGSPIIESDDNELYSYIYGS